MSIIIAETVGAKLVDNNFRTTIAPIEIKFRKVADIIAVAISNPIQITSSTVGFIRMSSQFCTSLAHVVRAIIVAKAVLAVGHFDEVETTVTPIKIMFRMVAEIIAKLISYHQMAN